MHFHFRAMENNSYGHFKLLIFYVKGKFVFILFKDFVFYLKLSNCKLNNHLQEIKKEKFSESQYYFVQMVVRIQYYVCIFRKLM